MANCDTRFAEALEFAGFWHIGGGLINGVDDSGGAGLNTMTDSTENFLTGEHAVESGYPIRNVTQGTFGTISGVAVSTLTTDILWDDGDRYQIASISSEMVAAIEENLDIAASDLHIVMQSVGACECTLSSAALVYLKKLNIIEAGVLYNNSCGNPNLSDAQRRLLLEWVNGETGQILSGEKEVCQGYTGSSYPVVGYAQGNWTIFSEMQLIIDSIKREGA